MEPKGKTKLLIDTMRAQPDKPLWTPAECAEITGIDKGLSAQLSGPLRRGWLYKHNLVGRRVAYGLHAPAETPAEEEPPREFNAALWADGDLVLMGVELNEDGHSVTLGPERVRLLCRLLHGQGPEA